MPKYKKRDVVFWKSQTRELVLDENNNPVWRKVFPAEICYVVPCLAYAEQLYVVKYAAVGRATIKESSIVGVLKEG
jgi:hypothetical protein